MEANNFRGFEFFEDETFSSIHKRLLRFFDITEINISLISKEKLEAFLKFQNEVRKIWLGC